MSDDSARLYAAHLNDLLGRPAEFFCVTPPDVSPPLWVLAYPDTPAPGHLTAFTWGVSDVMHPSWTGGRPELTLCLQTREMDWALALGHLALSQRGEIPFATGTILDLGQALADDTAMTGVFLHEPISLPQGTANRITLPDREIHLMGAFPMHPTEIDRCSLLGLEGFFTGSDWDPYSATRGPRGT